MAELAGVVERAADQLAVADQPPGEAGADVQVDEVAHLPADAEAQLGESRRVDVVVDRDRQPEARAKLGAEVDRAIDVEVHRVEPAAARGVGQPDEADADRRRARTNWQHRPEGLDGAEDARERVATIPAVHRVPPGGEDRAVGAHQSDEDFSPADVDAEDAGLVGSQGLCLSQGESSRRHYQKTIRRGHPKRCLPPAPILAGPSPRV